MKLCSSPSSAGCIKAARRVSPGTKRDRPQWYINGEYRNVETPIGQLMHDFFCANPEDMLNPLLRERVSYLKETEGGREEVCKIVEDLITEEKIEMAKAAIAEGDLTLEQIAKTLRLPLPFVQELAKLKTA